MVLAISILLLAVGAVVWGLDRGVSGVEASTIGGILMALGGIGLLATIFVSARAASARRATERLERDDAMAAAEAEGTSEDEPWPARAHRRYPTR